MSTFESHDREQLRRRYVDVWDQHRAGSILGPLEAMIAGVIDVHPEYHALLQDSARALALERASPGDEQNPFLHLGLHMAVREQIAIDRPPGVRDLQRRILARYGDAHRTEHMLMEALAQTLWEAQLAGQPPDEKQYLQLAERRLARGAST